MAPVFRMGPAPPDGNGALLSVAAGNAARPPSLVDDADHLAGIIRQDSATGIRRGRHVVGATILPTAGSKPPVRNAGQPSSDGPWGKDTSPRASVCGTPRRRAPDPRAGIARGGPRARTVAPAGGGRLSPTRPSKEHLEARLRVLDPPSDGRGPGWRMLQESRGHWSSSTNRIAPEWTALRPDRRLSARSDAVRPNCRSSSRARPRESRRDDPAASRFGRRMPRSSRVPFDPKRPVKNHCPDLL